jgi:hypothetical protein
MLPSSAHWDKRDVWKLHDGTKKALQVEFTNMLKCTKQKKKVVNANLEPNWVMNLPLNSP